MAAILCLALSLKLDRNRVDGARQTAEEAKGLLDDLRSTRARSNYSTAHNGDDSKLMEMDARQDAESPESR